MRFTRKRLNSVMSVLFALVLFTTMALATNTAGNSNKAGSPTDIGVTTHLEGNQTAATDAATNINTGAIVMTNAGKYNPMAFNEAQCFKDAATMENGTPPDNVQMAVVTNQKTDGSNARPPDEANMTAVTAQCNVAMIQMTARGGLGTMDGAGGMPGNTADANAPGNVAAAGYTAELVGLINANFINC